MTLSASLTPAHYFTHSHIIYLRPRSHKAKSLHAPLSSRPLRSFHHAYISIYLIYNKQNTSTSISLYLLPQMIAKTFCIFSIISFSHLIFCRGAQYLSSHHSHVHSWRFTASHYARYILESIDAIAVLHLPLPRYRALLFQYHTIEIDCHPTKDFEYSVSPVS